jgi:hypothetical protein
MMEKSHQFAANAKATIVDNDLIDQALKEVNKLPLLNNQAQRMAIAYYFVNVLGAPERRNWKQIHLVLFSTEDC